MLLIFKQYIKRSKRAIYPGYVLLKIYFFFISKFLVAVDILFKNSKPITGHDYFMEKNLDWNFFWFKRRIFWF